MEDPKACSRVAPLIQVQTGYVVGGVCVVRYDNEAGKGDHRHFDAKENAYIFQTPEKLLADFERDMMRWNRENRHS